MNISRINPVTDFVRNYRTYLDRIRTSRKAEILTVNGRPEAVLVDAESYQEMLEALEKQRFVQAVREGIADYEAGKTVPSETALGEIRKNLGL